MKRYGWFQLSTGLGIFLLFIVALEGCQQLKGFFWPPPTCNYNGNDCLENNPPDCVCNKK